MSVEPLLRTPLDSEDPTQNIPPRMRHHAGAQVLAPKRDQSVQSAKAGDSCARSDALITVRSPEEHGLQKHRNPPAMRKCLKLLLKIAAENQFLAESGTHGNANPKHYFQRSLRQVSLDGSSVAGTEPA